MSRGNHNSLSLASTKQLEKGCFKIMKHLHRFIYWNQLKRVQLEKRVESWLVRHNRLSLSPRVLFVTRTQSWPVFVNELECAALASKIASFISGHFFFFFNPLDPGAWGLVLHAPTIVVDFLSKPCFLRCEKTDSRLAFEWIRLHSKYRFSSPLNWQHKETEKSLQNFFENSNFLKQLSQFDTYNLMNFVLIWYILIQKMLDFRLWFCS